MKIGGWIALGVVGLVGAIVGYELYEKSKTSAAPVNNVPLTPGASTLNLSSGTGAYPISTTYSALVISSATSADPSIATATTSNNTTTITGVSLGQTTVSVAWTDSAGMSQTSTIAVIVNA